MTAHGDVHTAEELEAAREMAARLGARHVVITTNELAVPGFAANPPERCYLCRRDMYGRLIEMAQPEGMKTVVDGANRDDRRTTGRASERERSSGCVSPLAEAGMGKQEVRELARRAGAAQLGLPRVALSGLALPLRRGDHGCRAAGRGSGRAPSAGNLGSASAGCGTTGIWPGSRCPRTTSPERSRSPCGVLS